MSSVKSRYWLFIKNIALAAFLYHGMSNANASGGNSFSGLPWGFGSCCSGVPCGTIPCDMSCAGEAFDMFGEDTSDAEGELKDAYVDLGEETMNATNAVTELAWTGSATAGSVMSAISASTNAQTGMINILIKANEGITTDESTKIVDLFSKKIKFESGEFNKNMYLPKTEVGTFENAANGVIETSKVFSGGGAVFSEVFKKINEFQVEYEKNIEKGQGAAVRSKITQLTQDAVISYREHGGISKEAFEKNTFPSLIAFDSMNRSSLSRDAGAGATDQLVQKINKSKADAKTFHVASIVASDVQSPVAIASIYSKAQLVSGSGASLNQYLDQDPLTQKDWLQAVKLMSESDLRREMIIQDAHAAAIELNINRIQQTAGLAYSYEK